MSRVYVGNFDPRVTERELEDEFRIYGVLRSVWVARRPPGYAFIEFDDRQDALEAIRALDDSSREIGSQKKIDRDSKPALQKKTELSMEEYSSQKINESRHGKIANGKDQIHLASAVPRYLNIEPSLAMDWLKIPWDELHLKERVSVGNIS